MTSFDFHPQTRLIYGMDTLLQIGGQTHAIGTRALLVTDSGIVQSGHAQRATALLEAAGVTALAFVDVHENPTEDDAIACRDAAQVFGADCFVALGGGSSIDTAKAANLLLTNPGRIHEYVGHGKVPNALLPLIAVPTTAGTGSEMQSFAIIADSESHRKMPIGDPKLAPKIALLDPTLTVTAPPRVTAHTGMDAIVHAVESAVSANANAFSRMFSREAFRLLVTNFEQVLAQPGDLEARGAMLLGAAYAGLAIENSMLGAAHSLANAATARFPLSHGEAVGLFLPHVVRFNGSMPEVRAVYADLLASCGAASDGLDSSDRLADICLRLLNSAGMARSLSNYEIDATTIESLAADAASQRTARFNPRPIHTADFERLIRATVDTA